MNQAKDTTAPSEPDILPGFQSSTIKPRELSWPNDATVSESVDSIGRISVQDERQNYVGESHWAAILENVCFHLHTSPEVSDNATDSWIERLIRI